MLDASLTETFRHYPAQKKWYRALSQRAGVSILLDDRPNIGLSILMIQRAHHEADPWSGQMAFPGGKSDDDDEHITATALRESFEELNIHDSDVSRVGRLSDILARPYQPKRKPMVVSPLVFRLLNEPEIKPNDEVADVIWLPLSHFTVDENRQSMEIERFGSSIALPCYFYQEKRVWGLSLLMIDELVKLLTDRLRKDQF